jgi:hypothetical protein
VLDAGRLGRVDRDLALLEFSGQALARSVEEVGDHHHTLCARLTKRAVEVGAHRVVCDHGRDALGGEALGG